MCRKIIQKILPLPVILSLLLTLIPFRAEAAFDPGDDFTLYSKSAIVVNLDSDTVIYETDNARTERLYPASLVKIMTVMLVLELEDQPNSQMLTMTYEVSDALYGMGASNADLRPGEEISVTDLMYACMLPSACDAALVLATHYGGGNPQAFVQLMNQKAKELGCENTNFVNAHGLHDDNQYTTAYDMYLITKAALATEGFEQIATSTSYEMAATNMHPEARTYSHTNLMLHTGNYYEGAMGIKTGTTDESGKNLVSMASRGGLTYLSVTLGAPIEIDGVKDNYFVKDNAALYDWVFSSFSIQSVLKKTDIVETVSVNLSSDTDTLQLVPSEEISLLLPDDIDPSSIMRKTDVPESVDAPIEEGDVIGTVKLYLGGEEIASCDLVARTSVSQSIPLVIWNFILGALSSVWVIVILIIVVVLIAFYITITILYNRKMKKKRILQANRKKRK